MRELYRHPLLQKTPTNYEADRLVNEENSLCRSLQIPMRERQKRGFQTYPPHQMLFLWLCLLLMNLKNSNVIPMRLFCLLPLTVDKHDFPFRPFYTKKLLREIILSMILGLFIMWRSWKGIEREAKVEYLDSIFLRCQRAFDKNASLVGCACCGVRTYDMGNENFHL